MHFLTSIYFLISDETTGRLNTLLNDAQGLFAFSDLPLISF